MDSVLKDIQLHIARNWSGRIPLQPGWNPVGDSATAFLNADTGSIHVCFREEPDCQTIETDDGLLACGISGALLTEQTFDTEGHVLKTRWEERRKEEAGHRTRKKSVTKMESSEKGSWSRMAKVATVTSLAECVPQGEFPDAQGRKKRRWLDSTDPVPDTIATRVFDHLLEVTTVISARSGGAHSVAQQRLAEEIKLQNDLLDCYERVKLRLRTRIRQTWELFIKNGRMPDVLLNQDATGRHVLFAVMVCLFSSGGKSVCPIPHLDQFMVNSRFQTARINAIHGGVSSRCLTALNMQFNTILTELGGFIRVED